MLTREKCLQALSNLETRQTVERIDGNYCSYYMMINNYAESMQCFEQLIKEHFSNPPLAQEDICKLRGEPIWDNTYKYWIIVNTCCDAYDEFVVYDTLYGVVVDRAFEPGRYFRKKVE